MKFLDEVLEALCCIAALMPILMAIYFILTVCSIFLRSI